MAHETTARFRLSPQQRRVWSLQAREARPVYNATCVLALEGPVDVEALRRAVDAATAGFEPDLVVISAGFDSLRGDPLGAFTLELEHVTELTRWLVERAEAWCGGRLVSVLEGGYNVTRLGAACVAHLRALL